MARAITWGYEPDYAWDHESPIPRKKQSLMTIIIHPSKEGRKEINKSHPGEFKQMNLFYNETSDEYFYENTTAVRKGRAI